MVRSTIGSMIAVPPHPLALATALGSCIVLVALVVWVQGIELRLPLTFFFSRRSIARASHPVLQKLSGGRDGHATFESQSLLPIKLSPSGTRQLLFANFWVGLLEGPLSSIGMSNILSNPWAFASLVFVLEAVTFADATPRQLSDFLAQNDVGVRGLSPGIDTERYLASRRRQMKLLNAAFIALVSLAARAVDVGSTLLIGVPLGCLNVLLLVSTVLGGARQVDALREGANVIKRIDAEYEILETVLGRWGNKRRLQHPRLA